MFGAKHLKINRLQKNIEYQANEHSNNIQIEIWKYKAVRKYQVKLVLLVFASAFFSKLALN